MENKLNFRNVGYDVLVFASVLTLVTLAACSRDQPQTAVAAQPPAAQPAVAVAPAPVDVVVQDDYVYYPEYEVYYSGSRHQYMYRDGNAWIWRPAPPRVSINVLFASPSVHMDFHDSPALHHDVIVRSYPHNWAPAGRVRDDRADHKDERDDRKEHH